MVDFHVLGFAGFVYHALFRGGSRKSRKKGPSPPLSPSTENFTFFSLQPDCMIITTLKKCLEGLGSYKNVLKIEEKRGLQSPRPLP